MAYYLQANRRMEIGWIMLLEIIRHLGPLAKSSRGEVGIYPIGFQRFFFLQPPRGSAAFLLVIPPPGAQCRNRRTAHGDQRRFTPAARRRLLGQLGRVHAANAFCRERENT